MTISPTSILQEMLEHFDGGDWESARQVWDSATLEIEDLCWIWTYLDSKQRAFLKNVDRKYLDEYYRELRSREDIPPHDGSR